MDIRPTRLEDLKSVMKIYAEARQFMGENGNPTQWVNGYPTLEMVTGDIDDKSSYVCVEDEEVLGVFRFTIGIDPTYLQIYEGCWLDDALYGVVHRIASASRKKGVASYCLTWCLEQCGNIRIDTHRDNYIMQSLLLKNGYTRCGIIYLENGDERIAFQKRQDSVL